ncbi:MAG: ribose ABC transporter permease [Christensenellales bacterium]|nr:ribose ABC transporter permease [Christensenellales bacterium]HIR82121.1 ribose ABC transporter permease [Candidatus Limiplasma merdipullorum]
MEKRSDTFVKKFSGRFLAWFKQNIGILIGLAALMAIVSLFSESFFTASNMWNILRQISTNALLAFGMTFVILIGGIDLSVGPLLAFSGVFAAYVMGNLGWPIWAAIAGSIILCSMVGMLNGVIVTKTGIAPFVVTLSVQQIFRGFAMLLANGAPIRIRDQGFINIGTTYIGPVAFPVIYMIIIMALCYVVLNKTQFGRHIYALGGNKTAARFAGIRTQRIEVMVYALSGFLAGIAGIVLAARMTAGVPATGDGYECDAIAAVVLGGASFTGGIGTIGGTLIGAIIIGVLNNGLNMLNVASFWQYVAKGVVILLAVMVDVLRKQSKDKRKALPKKAAKA